MIDNNIKKDIKCIMIGSAIFCVICIMITLIIFALLKIDKMTLIYIVIGIAIGYIIGVLSSMHMARTIDAALYFQDEKQAKNHLLKNNSIRYIGFVVFVILISKFINPYMGLAIILGFYGIKIGAYMTPFIKKYIKN